MCSNICCGLGRMAQRWSSGDEAHREHLGTYAVSGSIDSSRGLGCRKQLVPDVCHEAPKEVEMSEDFCDRSTSLTDREQLAELLSNPGYFVT